MINHTNNTLHAIDRFAQELEDWFLNSTERAQNWSDIFDREDDTIKTEVVSEENHYLVTFELPGFTKKQIEIETKDDTLTVTAIRPNKTDDTQEPELKRSRTVSLGNDVSTDKINAKLANGILTLTLPKKEEPTAQKIKIS